MERRACHGSRQNRLSRRRIPDTIEA
jgi:hypothetical protein